MITLTIAEGSEDFISVAITLTNKNTTIVPHIITETPMTNAAMTITISPQAQSQSERRKLIPTCRLIPAILPKIAFADPVILARRAGIQHNRVVIIQKPRRQLSTAIVFPLLRE